MLPLHPDSAYFTFAKMTWTSISYYLLATYSSISDFVSHDSNNIVCLRDIICLVISNPSYFLSSVSISLNLKQWTLNPCKSPYFILWDFSFFIWAFERAYFWFPFNPLVPSFLFFLNAFCSSGCYSRLYSIL